MPLVKQKEYPMEYIGIPKAISKDLDEYKTGNPWIDGVRFSEKYIHGFQFSPKPYLLYVKATPKYPTTSFCFNNNSEVPKDLEIDMEKMLMNSAFKIVEKQLIMLKIDPKIIISYIDMKSKKQTLLSNWGITPQNIASIKI